LLKEIFIYIRKLKTPEASLVVIMLLGAVITIFSLYTTSSKSYVSALEKKIDVLEKRGDSTQKAMQKKIDDCSDQRFAERLDKIIQLENQAREKDSLIEKLRAINP